jgi:hypothetical protein
MESPGWAATRVHVADATAGQITAIGGFEETGLAHCSVTPIGTPRSMAVTTATPVAISASP